MQQSDGTRMQIDSGGEFPSQVRLSPPSSQYHSPLAPPPHLFDSPRPASSSPSASSVSSRRVPVKRAVRPPKLDEHGNPIPKKPRAKKEPKVDPATGEILPAAPAKRKRKAVDADSGAAGLGGEDASAAPGGSGGKRKAARKRAGSPGAEGTRYYAPPPPTKEELELRNQASAVYGRTKGPFYDRIAELLSPHHGDDRSPPPPLPESVCLLEEILVDALATITQSMLAVPQINISKDALQAAHSFANTRDGTGLTATTIATATPIDMDALLFVVKNNQHLHEKAKSMITALKPTMDAAQPAKKG